VKHLLRFAMHRHAFALGAVVVTTLAAVAPAGARSCNVPYYGATCSGNAAGGAIRQVHVTLHAGSVAISPASIAAGRTTLVVRSTDKRPDLFAIVEDPGGVNSLPRFDGLPFAPAAMITGKITTVAPHGSAPMTVNLASGSYLLVEGHSWIGKGTIFVDTAQTLLVR
jgi:hypothetical protein